MPLIAPELSLLNASFKGIARSDNRAQRDNNSKPE